MYYSAYGLFLNYQSTDLTICKHQVTNKLNKQRRSKTVSRQLLPGIGVTSYMENWDRDPDISPEHIPPRTFPPPV